MAFDFSTLITDRTAEDVAARNEKGTYNASDLNRVNAAMADLAGRFRARGCGLPGYQAFSRRVRLYGDGNEYPVLTGGWADNTNIIWAGHSDRADVTKGSSLIISSSANNRVGVVQTLKPIDAAYLTKMVVEIGNPVGSSYVNFGLSQLAEGDINSGFWTKYSAMWTPTAIKTYTIDISGLTGWFYPTVSYISRTAETSAATFVSMYVE